MSGRKEKKASGSGGKKPAEEQREQLLQAVVSATILGVVALSDSKVLGTRGFVRKKNPPAHTRDSTSKDFSESYISLIHSACELSFLCLAVSYSCSEHPSY